MLREGYGLDAFRHDAVAGLAVAIVALPLAIAIAIASGTTPEKGLLTAIIAGFLISALGGSRVQIGGPTGAFIPIVYAVIFRHGYDGLVLATCMAGIILVVAGLMRFGTLMKYMPQPLITGFTAGIAVIIFSSQIPDLLGLRLRDVPADFVPKLAAIGAGLGQINPWAVGLAGVSVVAIAMLRKWAPKSPGFLIVVDARRFCRQHGLDGQPQCIGSHHAGYDHDQEARGSWCQLPEQGDGDNGHQRKTRSPGIELGQSGTDGGQLGHELCRYVAKRQAQ